jgi:molybdopterin synthase catalytic subunit
MNRPRVRVRALLFASLKDAVGSRSVETELEDGATVDDLSRSLCALYPALGERLRTVRVAVNDAFAEPSTLLKAGDEVAYLPPVSGGAPDAHVEVTERELSIDAAVRFVKRPHCGALAVFLGTVRNNFQGSPVLGMEYEAHRVLAEHALADVVAQAQARWPAGAISVTHRIGRMEIGDVSVVVAVSTPHRSEAFEAARFIIDTLKHTVPIWKKEFLANGAVWIDGEERVTAS